MPNSAPIRVLIVDDSSVVRRLLTMALSAHRELELVGAAANGILALDKVLQLEPDALILDLEMPEMDGITMLLKLRQTHPALPVIIFSSPDARGAGRTFEALAAGASDYVLKPSAHDGDTIEGVVASSLVPKLLALVPTRRARVQPNTALPAAPLRRTSTSLTPKTASLQPAAKPRPSLEASSLDALLQGITIERSPGSVNLLAPRIATPSLSVPRTPPLLPIDGSASPRVAGALRRSLASALRAPVQVIAIAASTGGPNALADVISQLPAQLPVPIVIVQHMPPIFTRCLAERLDARSALHVLECAGGELLTRGNVYLARGGRHLELTRGPDGVHTLLSDGAPENSCRPAADVLFRSAARAYGSGVLGVVLTGMGPDGARGAREINDAGGRVIVQSGRSCVVWGMPRAVEEAGLADDVVPLAELAAAIVLRVGRGPFPSRPSMSSP